MFIKVARSITRGLEQFFASMSVEFGGTRFGWWCLRRQMALHKRFRFVISEADRAARYTS